MHDNLLIALLLACSVHAKHTNNLSNEVSNDKQNKRKGSLEYIVICKQDDENLVTKAITFSYFCTYIFWLRKAAICICKVYNSVTCKKLTI